MANVSKQQLREALLSAFPTRQDLEIMVSDQLHERLSAIIPDGNNLQYMVFELVEWAIAKGRLQELVIGAKRQNSQNTLLRKIPEQIVLQNDQETYSPVAPTHRSTHTTLHWISSVLNALKNLFISVFLLVVVFGIIVNSRWLISNNIDLRSTPLERLQDPLVIVLSSFCLALCAVLVWALNCLFEQNPSWFLNVEEKDRIALRQRFANSIAYEITRLGYQEDWKDYRFTELEAEVEAQGDYKTFKPLALLRFLLYQPASNLRHEKSLSEALRKSTERIILVEGEPGSGKSVALRHVALDMIKRFESTKDADGIIPIYVNMKLLERKDTEQVNRDLIENFIKSTLMRSNDRDVQLFLDNEFEYGMRNNKLLFLFDSFDEIPEILGSTEIDDKINEYGNAIDDFLHGINQCRGVIASRFYRGPTQKGWVLFKIIPLREKRQLQLISKTDLGSRTQEVMEGLANANHTIRSMASNPFFLALLCKYLKTNSSFPENTYVVFETYINQRFIDDERHLQRNFQLSADQVRASTEVIAFCMTASSTLGLNPTRANLQASLASLGFSENCPLEKVLDALEFMKLARPDMATNTGLSKSFTFSHRRFQEYFATCFVLREPKRVTPKQLLTQGVWRETAVVICQTQPPEKLVPLMKQVERLLKQFCAAIPDLIDNPAEYILDEDGKTKEHQRTVSRFHWPTGLYHLLSLLQDGCASRLTLLPSTVRLYIDQLVLSTIEHRTRDDKIWGLEVVGTASQPVLEYLLKSAFASRSQLLAEVAYRQAARLDSLSPEITHGIRKQLWSLFVSGRLRREQRATEAHLKRLSQGKYFLSIMRLLLWLLPIDFILLLIFLLTPISPTSVLIYLYCKFSIVNLLLWYMFVIVLSYILNRGLARIWLGLGFFGDKVKSSNISFNQYILNNILIRDIPTLVRLMFIVDIMPLIYLYFSIKNDLLFACGLYIMLFGPFAVLASYYGRYIEEIWLWPIIPLWPIIFIFLNISSIFNFVVVNIKKNKRFFIVICVIFCCLLIYRFVGMPYKLFVSIVLVFSIVLIILGICLVMLAAIPLSLGVFLYDRIRLQKWIRTFRGPITCEELCSTIQGYVEPDIAAVRIIRFVRNQRGLLETQETVEFLEYVILKVGLRLQHQERKNRVNGTLSRILRKILGSGAIGLFKHRHFRKYIHKKLNVRNMPPERQLILYSNEGTLDELCNLLKTVRSSTDKSSIA